MFPTLFVIVIPFLDQSFLLIFLKKASLSTDKIKITLKMVRLRLHTRKSVNVISASARKLIILLPLSLSLLSGLPHTDVEVIMSQTAQKPQFDNIQLDSNSDLRIFYIVSA